jgi:phosphoglycolate phosphatase
MPAPLHGVRGALVDLDGTLVDTLGDFDAALNATLAELGLASVSRGFIARTIGKGSEHLIRATLAEVGAADDRHEAAWSRYQAHYERVNGLHARVYPGVVEALGRWRAAGLRLVCLTNKPTRFARHLLDATSLLASFDQVYGGDAFERRKPDPLPLRKACEALGLPPAEVVMVGDSSNDAQAAHAAGLRVVLVRTGYNHGEPVDRVPALAHVDRLDALEFVPGPGPGTRPGR